MHFPLNFHFGPLTINAHLIFEILAYVLGFRYYLDLRQKFQDKISYEDRIWIIIAAAAGALFGSRLVGYLSVLPIEAHSWIEMGVILMSSKSIVGGLLGGLWGVEITKRWMGIKISTGDLFVYPVILGMMIGRVGCFSQGVFDGTHGNPSHWPWAIDMGDGIRRHPTQLYEILFLGILWFILKRLEYRLADGARFKIFMISYLLYRFLVEWIKPGYFYSFGLSAIQVACVLGLIYYLRDIIDPSRLLKKECPHGIA